MRFLFWFNLIYVLFLVFVLSSGFACCFGYEIMTFKNNKFDLEVAAAENQFKIFEAINSFVFRFRLCLGKWLNVYYDIAENHNHKKQLKIFQLSIQFMSSTNCIPRTLSDPATCSQLNAQLLKNYKSFPATINSSAEFSLESGRWRALSNDSCSPRRRTCVCIKKESNGRINIYEIDREAMKQNKKN